MEFPSIQARFAAQVARTPNATALSHNGGTMTYLELDERSDRLARHLAGLGAGPEVPVVVLVQRSPELVIALLAVLKTGAYYVPLHTAFPLQRWQQITDQFDNPLLLLDEESKRTGVPQNCREVLVDGPLAEQSMVDVPLPVPGDPDELAYVMFTSGSTGEPKGGAVTHRAALGLALDPIWDSAAYERCLMVSPTAFSISSFELWVPLLHGTQIVIHPGRDIDLGTLGEVIAREQVTTVHLTAGLFRVVAEEVPQLLAPLREVITGGDRISPAAVARVLRECPDLVVRATYGATETALFIVTSPITAPYQAGSSVPVGRPLSSKQVHLLDDELKPVTDGEVGEIYVAGPGLARGYLGQPVQTAERFVPNPLAGGGERMYRTGDLGRWAADGQLELLGRVDDQVKIRGFRVEPGEVEAVLATHPGVRHAAVIPRDVEAGDKRLIAYVVPNSTLSTAQLRDHAVDRLPDYMVPAAYVMLEELPMTANGKIDRAALPNPSAEDGSRLPAAPQPSTAELLCTMFAETLGQESVGVDDDFFDLSGQSMQAIRLMARIEQHTGVRASIAVLYENPTPALLAVQIDAERDGSSPANTASA